MCSTYGSWRTSSPPHRAYLVCAANFYQTTRRDKSLFRVYNDHRVELQGRHSVD